MKATEQSIAQFRAPLYGNRSTNWRTIDVAITFLRMSGHTRLSRPILVYLPSSPPSPLTAASDCWRGLEGRVESPPHGYYGSQEPPVRCNQRDNPNSYRWEVVSRTREVPEPCDASYRAYERQAFQIEITMAAHEPRHE